MAERQMGGGKWNEHGGKLNEQGGASDIEAA